MGGILMDFLAFYIAMALFSLLFGFGFDVLNDEAFSAKRITSWIVLAAIPMVNALVAFVMLIVVALRAGAILTKERW